MPVSTIKLSSPANREFWEIPVLFEDEHLLAINKPVGLPLTIDPDKPDQPALMQLLHQGIAEAKPWAAARKLEHLANVHRLDDEISGVLLLARTKPAHDALASLFGSNRPLRTFVALLPGTPPNPGWEVDAPIAKHTVREGVMVVSSRRGKKSKTVFEVREQFRGFTLIECRPLTDRRHQIRVHLRHWGLPICGDQTYGGKPLLLSRLKKDFRLKPGKTERPLISTVALHAERLNFDHPVTGAPVEISAPWPKDFSVSVKYLRRYARLAGSDSADVG